MDTRFLNVTWYVVEANARKKLKIESEPRGVYAPCVIVKENKDMIIEKTIGRLQEFPNHTIDYVDIEWYNAFKKIDRVKTRAGREVGIRLNEHAAAHGLMQNDVLAVVEDVVIAVDIIPCECLIVEVEDPHKLPKFCYEIGNRHAPFFYGTSHTQFVIPYDKPMQLMIEKLGIEVKVDTFKINLAHNISSSHGGHSHDHH